MKPSRTIFYSLLFLLFHPVFYLDAYAWRQEDHPPAKPPGIRCLLLGGYAAICQPNGKLSEDYGTFGEAGGSILYLSKKRFLFGLEGGFIFGGNVLKDPVPNLRNPDGTISGADGRDAVFKVYQRGSNVPALRAGYLLPFRWPMAEKNTYGGYSLSAGCSWFRNYTYIEDISKKTPQFSDQYRIGYDRLVTGPALGFWFGYLYMPENNLLNLMLEAGYMTGFTQTARYSFPTQEPAGVSRRDNVFQLRLKLYFTIRSRDENTIYYY
jgi:hypothetical protein